MATEYRITEEEARRLREESASHYRTGTHFFPEMIRGKFFYIDKTEYVYKMAHDVSKYISLSRPRRFGKSMLVSTLQNYFEGRRDLFIGLKISGMEKEWKKHPVLHFDLSSGEYGSEQDLVDELSSQLAEYERKYGRYKEDIGISQRFKSLIKNASMETGEQAVVLIDEYDKPLTDVIHDNEALAAMRKVLKRFLSPLKPCGQYLRFVFLTGITEFSQMSIFSELNNIMDISMDKEYAAACGFTRDELLYQMPEEIDKFALIQGTTRKDILDGLKSMYDGYRFTWPSPEIYNPYSLMQALAKKELGSYWFKTGTPTYLIEALKKLKVAPSKIGGNSVMANSFHAPAERLTDIIPLLYQSGYLTITDYNPENRFYTLDIPNNEVSSGLFETLLPYYVNLGKEMCDKFTEDIREALDRDDVDGMMTLLKEFFSSIPYASNTNYEGHYQQIMFIIYRRLTKDVHLEEHTAEGRIDLVVEFRGKMYIFELKVDGSAEEALRQIDSKNYAARYSFDGLPVVKVGVNFDSKARTISDWIIKYCVSGSGQNKGGRPSGRSPVA